MCYKTSCFVGHIQWLMSSTFDTQWLRKKNLKYPSTYYFYSTVQYYITDKSLETGFKFMFGQNDVKKIKKDYKNTSNSWKNTNKYFICQNPVGPCESMIFSKWPGLG